MAPSVDVGRLTRCLERQTAVWMLRLERSEQMPPAGRNILKLVYEDMSVRTAIAPRFDIVRGANDHVLKVDAVCKATLVRLEDRFKYL